MHDVLHLFLQPLTDAAFDTEGGEEFRATLEKGTGAELQVQVWMYVAVAVVIGFAKVHNCSYADPTGLQDCMQQTLKTHVSLLNIHRQMAKASEIAARQSNSDSWLRKREKGSSKSKKDAEE
jgi:hypothetical protein